MKLKYNSTAVGERIKQAVRNGEKPRARDITWYQHDEVKSEKGAEFRESFKNSVIENLRESRNEH